METATLTPGSVPLLAAPFLLAYPQFESTSLPSGSDGIRAWIGNIQPFTSDTDARNFLTLVEKGNSCSVDCGNLLVPAVDEVHPYSAFLIDMTRSCRVMIIEQGGTAHPRAYLLSPRYDQRTATFHPHARMDQFIAYAGAALPGMCIYSAAEHHFKEDEERLVQFMDLVTLHVARHLIWLKTRSLYRIGLFGKLSLVRSSKPGDYLPEFPLKPDEVWLGYWPGPRARAIDPAGHVQNIRPQDECWCGSGFAYKDCHRQSEVQQARLQKRK